MKTLNRQGLKAHIETLVENTFDKLKQYFFNIPIPTSYAWRSEHDPFTWASPVIIEGGVLKLDTIRLVEAPIRYQEENTPVELVIRFPDKQYYALEPIPLGRLREILHPKFSAISRIVPKEPPLSDLEIQGFVAEAVGEAYLETLIPPNSWLRQPDLVARIVMRGIEQSFYHLFAGSPTNVAESVWQDWGTDKRFNEWLVQEAGVSQVEPLLHDYGEAAIRWFMDWKPTETHPRALPRYFEEAHKYLEEHPY